MSCNGCRILRKGCSENCMLRQSLQWIDNPQSQSHATLFVAKFFGRAGLMSFISSVPDSHKPALFQSLLFEAVGRTVNPVTGVVGLLWSGNWHACQSAVETVLRGGVLRMVPELPGGVFSQENSDNALELADGDGGSMWKSKDSKKRNRSSSCDDHQVINFLEDGNLDSEIMANLVPERFIECGGGRSIRAATPTSEESGITTWGSGGSAVANGSLQGGERKLLRLFI